jgi:hypothetical protein
MVNETGFCVGFTSRRKQRAKARFMATTMNISLSETLRDFVEEAVDAGGGGK